MISLTVDIDEVKANGQDVLLRDVHISLGRSGIVWVCGLNASGKSLLAGVLSGAIGFGHRQLSVKGRVKLVVSKGRVAESVDGVAGEDYLRNVAFLPQRVGASLVAIHHQDDICLGLEGRLRSLGENDATREEIAAARLDDILRHLHLGPFLTRRLEQTSYGETRRIETGCTLVTVPSTPLIVLDEPFSGLDRSNQAAIAVLIRKLAQSSDSIWVITSHHTPEEVGLQADIIIDLAVPERSIETFTTIAGEFKRRFFEPAQCAPEAIQIEGLSVERGKPRKEVCKLSHFRARPGEVTVLAGPNGSGKSTVSQVVAGLLASSVLWRIRIRAADVSGLQFGQPGAKRMLLQNPLQSFLFPRVNRDLEHMFNLYSSDGDIKGSYLSCIEAMFGGLDREPATFSFGQLRFLQFLLLPPTCTTLVADEPFLGLHPSVHTIMDEMLRTVSESGRIVIFTSQPGDGTCRDYSAYHLCSSGAPC
jgi:energy-coupling factor transporter ATP-binding protein EcfA2